MLTTSTVLAWLFGYHSLVSLFLIGLLGYRGGTRSQVPTVHHPIKLSFISCCPVPVTWTPRLDLWELLYAVRLITFIIIIIIIIMSGTQLSQFSQCLFNFSVVCLCLIYNLLLFVNLLSRIISIYDLHLLLYFILIYIFQINFLCFIIYLILFLFCNL